jgi:3-isopropylmalate/(R)-2-methylmalate dehydratase small subunit
LYFRNAFNLGLLLLTCKQASSLEEGEAISLDLKQWAVVRTNGQRLACDPIPDFLVAMVEAGGLLPQLKQRLQSERDSS